MNYWKASTFALTAVVLAGGVYSTVRPAHADAQPRMQAALQQLEGAKTHLENATADKGGHRVKAIAATKEAIEQVKKGIEYDNTHKSGDEKK